MYQEVFQKHPRGDHCRLLGKLGRIFKILIYNPIIQLLSDYTNK